MGSPAPTDQVSAPSPSPSPAPSPAPAPAASLAASPPVPTPSPTPAPAPPARPDWLPETFFNAASGPKWDDFGKHFSELATRDAAAQIARNALPQKVDDYKVELPKDFQLPQGVEFKFDGTKPEFTKFREVALKHGLSQDAVTELTGVYAETLVGSETSLQAARKAEVDKLGANGPARVTALQTWLNGMLGEDMGKSVAGMLVTEKIVRGFEQLAAKHSSQGSASFSQAHRDAPNDPKRVTEEQYQKMSAAERLDYVRQFDQRQFNGAAR